MCEVNPPLSFYGLLSFQELRSGRKFDREEASSCQKVRSGRKLCWREAGNGTRKFEPRFRRLAAGYRIGMSGVRLRPQTRSVPHRERLSCES
jgi:hypothetical protein